MKSDLVSGSKFLSLVLRHKPEVIGVQLTDDGWVDIAELLTAVEASGRNINHEQLLQIVAENDKQRFVISSDGRRIRASQGHSLNVDLGLNPVIPPNQLFHGTVARFLDSIREQGLIPGTRQHVHLSADAATAETVGRRRGRAIVLTVAASRMHDDGTEFFRSANGVWLTHHVSTDYIQFPSF